ncbi:DUF1064 domain-containing protein [Clostridium botulinum]|uniref:DUF1064 domain-containing protein n=1 Tax=Clostridium TaxID=1485 RepID=UPI001400B536|nr:DUF1064 domain-containing protein [Clostridium botulinum]MBY6838625.1 DUF1064 domain-containing protein [Clostridium botulinum]NFH00766.1 DUF1064 domain-containing protein [Clostridium botulinum]
MAFKKRNKYHNIKTTKYNQKWDSEMELDYYESVCLPKLETGEFKSVETQRVFILQEKFKCKDKTILPIKYIADFVIETKDKELIIVDTKGMPPTTDFKLKWKMMKFKYPQYDYQCLRGTGRDKRKGIMHYQKWEQVKGC